MSASPVVCRLPGSYSNASRRTYTAGKIRQDKSGNRTEIVSRHMKALLAVLPPDVLTSRRSLSSLQPCLGTDKCNKNVVDVVYDLQPGGFTATKHEQLH